MTLTLTLLDEYGGTLDPVRVLRLLRAALARESIIVRVEAQS